MCSSVCRENTFYTAGNNRKPGECISRLMDSFPPHWSQLNWTYKISSFAVTAQDTRPFECPRSILIKMLLIRLWWAIKQSRIPTAWFMCLYILLLASLAWLQQNYIWICLAVDARAAEVSWIFLSLILEHAEDTALLLNKRIIKPPPVTTIISKCTIAGLRPNVSWGVQGQVSSWRKRRKLLFHQAESVPGRSPVVWKQMVPSADWEKVCVSSRNTAAMMELYCTAPCFARISEPCIKYAALLIAFNCNNNVSGHFLSPVSSIFTLHHWLFLS